mgnify:CR=1 FL=1
MKTIIEKQILEWKEELAKQVKTKDQAERVLGETNRTILMIQGGIQAKEMLLKKIESSDQPTGIVELNQESKPKSSK